MHIEHTTESEIPSNKWKITTIPVVNPDFQIRGDPGHPDPEIRGGGGRSQKNFFRPFRSSVWSKK